MNQAPPEKRRKRTPRFTEIAALAGVSVSTVDRVLNEREGVSEAARSKVVEAARSLGVRRILPALKHGVLRWDVVFEYEQENAYYRRLKAAVHHHAQLLGSRIAVHRHYWTQGSEEKMVRLLEQPPHRRQGLMIVARDNARVRRAVQAVARAGVPVVTLTSDISGVDQRHYTGIDNEASGRTAACLTGQLARRPGRVALLVTSMAYRAHVQRVAGFSQVLRQRYPHLEIGQPLETLDSDDLAHSRILQALQDKGREIVAIYNTGVGSAGVAAALHSLPRERWPVWITHEATAEHVRLMREGRIAIVLDQDPEAQVLAGFRRLLHACGEIDDAPLGPTRFRLLTPENLDTNDGGE